MFCRSCGKVLHLNSGNTCPECGKDLLFCRNCGKGLATNPDKTCANCSADPVKSTSFCRYCGKPTGPKDINCPACRSFLNTIPVADKTNYNRTVRKIAVGTSACAVLVLGALMFLPAVNKPVSMWISTMTPPKAKVDTSKNVTIDLVIENGKFYPDKIYAEAGANLIINFTNKDVGVEHNFVVYREMEGAALAMTILPHVTGPGSAVYRLKVPKYGPDGSYWFACDNHYATEQGFLYPTWPTP